MILCEPRETQTMRGCKVVKCLKCVIASSRILQRRQYQNPLTTPGGDKEGRKKVYTRRVNNKLRAVKEEKKEKDIHRINFSQTYN